MKKLLAIIVLGLLLSGNAYAKKIKNGSGPLNLTESDVKTFHIYLTEKLSRDGLNPSFNGKKLSGFHGGSPEKSVYADYFLIQYDNQPYIWAWGSSMNQNPGTTLKVMKSSGYVTEAHAIEVALKNGFELVTKSEINANPKDTKDHPKGVWTLPPRLRLDDVDTEKYESIGESDRMTLLFRKPL